MEVQIKNFTGPLDVLLQLIQREEMDIFSVDLHKITDQYLAFLESQPLPNLHSAGDFIRLAAVLIYLKSKNLFPDESPLESESAEPDEQELKADLRHRLLRMKLVQSIAQQLNCRPLLGRDVWRAVVFEEESVPAEEETGTQPLFKLLKAYYKQDKLFKRALQNRRTKKSFTLPAWPMLFDYLADILPIFRPGRVFSLDTLLSESLAFTAKEGGVPVQTQSALLAFLSLLELSRLGVVSLSQKKAFLDIEILVKKQFNKKNLRPLRKELAI